MPPPDPPELARRLAEQIVAEEQLDLPIDPAALALTRGVAEVLAKPAQTRGVSGMLLRVPRATGDGNEYIIAYATHIESEGFQRFSIAHELGHFCLPGHPDAVLMNGLHQSHAGFTSSDRYEREADAFAAGLLMPAKLFARAMDRAGQGFAAIEHLSGLCKTSLPATAIRYANLTEEAVAIVMSTGQRIDYCFMSESLKRIAGYEWLRKGDSIPPGTHTAAFNRDPRNISSSARRAEGSNLLDWLSDGRDWEIAEDIVGLGSYGRTLTILFSDSPVPDEEDDEDEEIGSWDPTFRRSRRR